MSDFNDFEQFERECQPVMDMFYAQRGHEIVTRKGTKKYDLILKINGAATDWIEEKFRNQVRGDLLVEMVQDFATFTRGWFYETACTHLHYVMCDETRVPFVLYRVDFPDFKRWLLASYLKSKRQPTWRLSVRGWGLTLNLVVPIKDIPADLYQVAYVTRDLKW